MGSNAEQILNILKHDQNKVSENWPINTSFHMQLVNTPFIRHTQGRHYIHENKRTKGPEAHQI